MYGHVPYVYSIYSQHLGKNICSGFVNLIWIIHTFGIIQWGISPGAPFTDMV